MKVRYAKILLLTIASVGLSAGLLYAAKPSLQKAIDVGATGTIRELLAVIQTASGKGDFFIFDAQRGKAQSVQAARITLDMDAKIGGLSQDPGQIEAIKKELRKSSTFKRKNRQEQKNILAWVDRYLEYLLYFTYTVNDTPVKVYINNPWPQATPNAVYQIIQKWDR